MSYANIAYSLGVLILVIAFAALGPAGLAAARGETVAARAYLVSAALGALGGGGLVLAFRDARGGGIFTRMRRLALSKGRGWVHYSWYSPCTRSMQPKMSYIIRVGRYIVGVGTYKVPGV